MFVRRTARKIAGFGKMLWKRRKLGRAGRVRFQAHSLLIIKIYSIEVCGHGRGQPGAFACRRRDNGLCSAANGPVERWGCLPARSCKHRIILFYLRARRTPPGGSRPGFNRPYRGPAGANGPFRQTSGSLS